MKYVFISSLRLPPHELIHELKNAQHHPSRTKLCKQSWNKHLFSVEMVELCIYMTFTFQKKIIMDIVQYKVIQKPQCWKMLFVNIRGVKKWHVEQFAFSFYMKIACNLTYIFCLAYTYSSMILFNTFGLFLNLIVYKI